jgi:hypothetical protein
MLVISTNGEPDHGITTHHPLTGNLSMGTWDPTAILPAVAVLNPDTGHDVMSSGVSVSLIRMRPNNPTIYPTVVGLSAEGVVHV